MLVPALVAGSNLAGRLSNMEPAGTVMTVVVGKLVGLVMRMVACSGMVKAGLVTMLPP